jgi:hypothetical protein
MHIISGLDIASVQRWFANQRDSKCMHGLSMNTDCDDCRAINCERNPDIGYCDNSRVVKAIERLRADQLQVVPSATEGGG